MASKFNIHIASSTGAVVVGDGSSITVHHGVSKGEKKRVFLA